MNMVLCKLLQHILVLERANIVTEDATKPFDANKIEHLFMMCATWAFGGGLIEKDNRDYRKELVIGSEEPLSLSNSQPRV